MAFQPVNSAIDFPQMEREILQWWYSSGVIQKYLHRNDSSTTQFSFLDGPITANNPMGVHHAWGRTYKDLWQKYHNFQGDRQRFQAGFDCQGLWVEVEVEKELGFKSKKDIETYGVAEFVNKCKERVYKYSGIQTEQSKRLAFLADWDNSYFTMSDKNNYDIWAFLAECWHRDWIIKSHDVVPWCPRCETAISQHEILTEDYKEITHDSIYLRLPLIGRTQEYLLIWTTTPWTLIANTAVSVDPKLDYSLVEDSVHDKYWVASARVPAIFAGQNYQVIATSPGKSLLGLHYQSPFDSIPVVAQALSDYPRHFHLVVATDPFIMPISTEEGTGLVHTSTSTGEEDHQLGVKLGLPVIPTIDDQANYLPGFGKFSGTNAKKHPEIIFDYLSSLEQEGNKWIFAIVPYQHRYPACWRCKTELVWKVADEWYITMDRPDPTDPRHRTFRRQMIDNVKHIKWLPGFGLERELDWLKNMHNWLISKKNRYWGLALPIYECPSCGHFEVIGSKADLEKRAVSGWDKFSGHSPHKPWIDEVKIKCTRCSSVVSRILDVGNPWLDAGIVGFSTLPSGWFPADFITESFPGQFKNWFYSLIAMSTVLQKDIPTRTILGFATALAEDGRPMHKSWGNYIDFNEGADKIGVDVMRWMFALQKPENDLLFGYKTADEIRRRFHLILWNIYNFFITYANLDGFSPDLSISYKISTLDKWILARLQETVYQVTQSLDKYDAYTAAQKLESFVSDLSLWYVRRSRDRVGPAAAACSDKLACHFTLWQVLSTLSVVLAPFITYFSEAMYRNLTGSESVLLANWPVIKRLTASQRQLVDNMQQVRKIVELGLAQRKTSQIKVRQPLSLLTVTAPFPALSSTLVELIKAELNVKQVNWQAGTTLSVMLDFQLTPELIAEGQLRELIRTVQDLRKTSGAKLDQQIILHAPLPVQPHLLDQLRRSTLAKELIQADEVSLELV